MNIPDGYLSLTKIGEKCAIKKTHKEVNNAMCNIGLMEVPANGKYSRVSVLGFSIGGAEKEKSVGKTKTGEWGTYWPPSILNNPFLLNELNLLLATVNMQSGGALAAAGNATSGGARSGNGGKGGGEGEAHRALKEFVAKTPGLVCVGKTYTSGLTEHPLPSGDSLDVFFSDSTSQLAVEVKSRVSNVDDVRRGIFQCVKYKAVLEAENIVRGELRTVDVVLVLEGALIGAQKVVADKLGIRVIEGVRVSVS